MNNYISSLKNLICGYFEDNTYKDGQIDTFIKKVMRKEYWVDSARRKDEFLDLKLPLSDPKHPSKSIDDGTTTLQWQGDNRSKTLNSNPNYRPNMIEVLNTPFDHIERIVLQDFSQTMLGNGNYFKGLFHFPCDEDGKYNGGFSGFTMEDPEGISDFSDANIKFKPEVNQNIGGFFIDSFTYTPFVDYSQVGEGGNSRVGVYSDEFITDYNLGKYDESDVQVDKHHHKLSSKLYELGNLKKDLEDAKVAFRNAITLDDNLNK